MVGRDAECAGILPVLGTGTHEKGAGDPMEQSHPDRKRNRAGRAGVLAVTSDTNTRTCTDLAGGGTVLPILVLRHAGVFL